VNEVKKMVLDMPTVQITDLPLSYVPHSVYLHSFEDPSVELVSQRHNSLLVSEAKTIWNVRSDKKGTQLVEVHYETDDLYWCATYIGVITSPELITLTGHYNINNHCGKSFVQPKVILVDEHKDFLLQPQEILPQLVDGDHIRIHFLEKTEIPVISKKLIRLSPHDMIVEGTIFDKKITGARYGTAKDVIVINNEKKDHSFLTNLPNGSVFMYRSLTNQNHEPLANSPLQFNPSSAEISLEKTQPSMPTVSKSIILLMIHVPKLQKRYKLLSKANMTMRWK